METIEFHSTYSAITGQHADALYIPTADLDTLPGNRYGLTLDGVHPYDSRSGWHALTGHRSHLFGMAYQAVFDPAENADDDLIREWVCDAGGDTFALVEVGAHDDNEPVFPEQPDYCETYGCAHDPAGWAVLYQMGGE